MSTSGASLHILIVDDEVGLRRVLGEVLAAAGHRPDAVADGVQALRRFAFDLYDVVVSDVHMPGLDGWAVARGVRAMRPEVGVVLMSGVPIDGPRRGTAPQRMLEDIVWLDKPFAAADLMTAVERSLKPAPPGRLTGRRVNHTSG